MHLPDLRVIEIARREDSLCFTNGEPHAPLREISHLLVFIMLVGGESLIGGKAILNDLKILSGVDDALHIPLDNLRLEIRKIKERAKHLNIHIARVAQPVPNASPAKRVAHATSGALCANGSD